jgi:hypothetical protein
MVQLFLIFVAFFLLRDMAIQPGNSRTPSLKMAKESRSKTKWKIQMMLILVKWKSNPNHVKGNRLEKGEKGAVLVIDEEVLEPGLMNMIEKELPV